MHETVSDPSAARSPCHVHDLQVCLSCPQMSTGSLQYCSSLVFFQLLLDPSVFSVVFSTAVVYWILDQKFV